MCLDAHERSLHATCVIASADATGLSWSRPGRGLVTFSSSDIALVLLRVNDTMESNSRIRLGGRGGVR